MRPRHAADERARGAWAAVTGTGAAGSVALALLVLVCAFIAVAVPRASLGYRTAVLQHIFRTTSSAQTTVLADANITGEHQTLGTDQLASIGGQLHGDLHRDRLPLAPSGADWSGLVTASAPFAIGGRPPDTHYATPQVELVYRSGLPANATVVSGALPGSPGAHVPSGTLPVAVTAATAARFGLRPGNELHAAGLVLTVTGIVRPRGAASSFWTVDPVAAAPLLTYPTPNSSPYWSSGAFVGAAGGAALQGYLVNQPLHALWSFPLALGGVNADQAAALGQAVQAVSYLPAAASVGSSLNATAGSLATIQVSLSDGLSSVLPSFVATDDAVQRALSLLFVSLAVIAAVVVLLGCRLVAAHRRDEFAMMRARGASLRQVAAVALAGGAAAVLPAAVVAVLAAVAVTPGPASQLSWWLAGLILVTALAGTPLLAVWQHRTRRRAASAADVNAAGARRRIAAARRWVGDVALACAAVGGLVVLRQQGLPPPGSVDLFTSAAPVLVAVPVALLIMRVYPLVLRQLVRLTRRRRGVVLVVGFARGSAAAAGGTLAAFALVLSLAVVAFAAMASGAVTRADVSASWQATGADAVVTAPAAGPGIIPAAQHLITRVPGVSRSAAVSVVTGTSGQGLTIPVVILDPPQYARLTSGTPLPAFPAAALARPGSRAGPPGGAVPVLISQAGRALLGVHGILYAAGRQFATRQVGTVNAVAGVTAGSQFAVVPRWALGGQAPPATVLALTGSRLDETALLRTARRAVPGSQVVLRSRVLAGIARAPLPHGGVVTFIQGAAAAGAFGILIFALMLVLSARSREMTLARLTTMGLQPGQSRRISAVETLPAVLAAAVGGTICAIALVPLVGPSLNLAAFTGTPVSVPLHADPVALAAAAAGLLLLAALTLTIQDRLARGRGATQALRVGE
jgi:putative ABC transport system permease protein